MKDTLQVELKSKDIECIRRVLFEEYVDLQKTKKEYNEEMHEVFKLYDYFHNLKKDDERSKLIKGESK